MGMPAKPVLSTLSSRCYKRAVIFCVVLKHLYVVVEDSDISFALA